MATEKVDISMYNNEVTITFLPNSHTYKIDWEKIISVSAICWILDKPALIYRATWLTRDYLINLYNNNHSITSDEIIRASNLHREKKAEATYTGTLVHNYVEQYTRWEQPELPEDEWARNWILAFLKRKTDHNVEFILQEKLVYSKQYGYVGRFDAIIRVDWKVYLADYKTSKDFYPMEMWMQTAWYLQALQEETGMELDWRMILRFDKNTGEFHVHTLDDYEADRIAFNSALILAKRKKYLDSKK